MGFSVSARPSRCVLIVEDSTKMPRCKKELMHQLGDLKVYRNWGIGEKLAPLCHDESYGFATLHMDKNKDIMLRIPLMG